MVGKLRYLSLASEALGLVEETGVFCAALGIEELSSWLYSLPTHTMSCWSKLGINLSPAIPDVNMERILGSSRRKTFDPLGITH
jgi:hypothetical protein